MSHENEFGEVDGVEVTILVDNWADMIIRSTDTVKHFGDRPLLAEHGFAALIELKPVGTRILWDTGMMPGTMLENMRRMEIDPATIDKIALSHGHGDHTAGMTDFLRARGARPRPRKWDADSTTEEMMRGAEWNRIPLIVHPAAFRERWTFPKEGSVYGPVIHAPEEEWRAHGAEIVLSEGPYRLGPGCWTTGAVPRLSFEKSGTSSSMRYRQADAFLADVIEDDQAIVIHIKDKGLVVLAGCAHSGIVNTSRYAREISGVNGIWAILGGFHLAVAPDDEIEMTVEEIRQFKPELIAPSHCTGFRAICRFATQMAGEFSLGVVGTKYTF